MIKKKVEGILLKEPQYLRMRGAIVARQQKKPILRSHGPINHNNPHVQRRQRYNLIPGYALGAWKGSK